MPWWFWVLPLPVILLAVVRLLVVRPAEVRVRPGELQACIDRLTAGPNDGLLLVLRPSGTGFLQLSMRRGPAVPSVALGLPEVDWSAARFDQVVSALRAAGCEIQVDDGSACAEVRRYLRASVVGSGDELPARTLSMLQTALRELGWDGDEWLAVRFERG